MIKVEIRNYKPMNKGSLRGFFTLVVHPMRQKILDCRHLCSDKGEWFAFPQKDIKTQDKTDYIPYISYEDKEYLEQLKIAVLKEIHGQPAASTKESAYPKNKERYVPSQPSFNDEFVPF